MSELNKKLSALHQQQAQQTSAAATLQPAAVTPLPQPKPWRWSVVGVCCLLAAGGVGWWLGSGQVQTVTDKTAMGIAATDAKVDDTDATATETTAKTAAVKAPEANVPEANVPETKAPAGKVTVTATEDEAIEETAVGEIASGKIATQKIAAKDSAIAKTTSKSTAQAEDSATVAQVVNSRVAAGRSAVTPEPEVQTKPAPQVAVRPAPASRQVNDEPVTVASAYDDEDVDAFESYDDMQDTDEQPAGLEIETVELDAGQLAQVEYNRAQKAMKEGNTRKAIGYYEAALKYQPEWVSARQKLAALYYGRGDARHALNTLQKGLEFNHTQPDLRLTLAKLLMNESQPQAALNVLSAMPEKDHSGYLAMRGALAQQLQNNAMAKSSYQRLSQTEPYDGRWWLGLAIALERSHDAEQAREAYQQALLMGRISATSQQFIQQRLTVLSQAEG